MASRPCRDLRATWPVRMAEAWAPMGSEMCLAGFGGFGLGVAARQTVVGARRPLDLAGAYQSMWGI